jgi:5-methylcytosine-specific restriction enzyme subunit McrC
MRTVVSIKEFDTITCKADDKIEYGTHRLSKQHFDELMTFVREYTAEDSHADALQFMKVGYKRNVGDVISLNNYVGVVETSSGLQIEILPKIDFGENPNDTTDTKKIFLKMLRTMREFEGKIFRDASLMIDRMNLYEIFINMYLQETRRLVKKGLNSSYIRQEDNLEYYKGKLMVNQHIRNNLVHREKFYVSYSEFHPNRAENKLIKSTLLKLRELTKSAENTKEIYRLLTFFEMVEPSVNYQKDFSKVIIDRNTKEYEMLMQWSKVFLMNQSFATFSGAQNSKAILFPMESVYESYVAHMLKKIMTPLGWDVSTQDKGYYLFDKPNPKFALRPDIVLRKNKRCVVLDTKWKTLMDNPAHNYGISQGDMYQIYAYSKKYKTPEIWLLYPMIREFRKHRDIIFRSSQNEIQEIKVTLFFIDLTDESNILKLGNIIEAQGLDFLNDCKKMKQSVELNAKLNRQSI